jgi:hypothetical protein
LARLKGKKMAMKMKNTDRKNAQINVLEKILPIAENKMIMKTSDHVKFANSIVH